MKFFTTLENNTLFIGESVFLLILLASFIGMFTYIDITVHDFYSEPIGELCYTGNHNPDCTKIQQLHNCPSGGDACIEAMYYQMLQVQAFYLAGLMAGIKIAMAIFAKRKINKTRIFQAGVWALTPLVLLWTGWEDFLYYATRNKVIPDSLPWLNNAGLFPFVDNRVLHVAEATSMSLYIVMAVGFVIIGLMLFGNIKVTKSAGYKTPI